MYKNYGYWLYENQDIEQALIYIYGDNWKQVTTGMQSTDISTIIFAANMKRVQAVSTSSLLPYIGHVMTVNNINSKVVMLPAAMMIEYTGKNSHHDPLINKFKKFMANELFGLTNVWLELKDSPPELQRSIKRTFMGNIIESDDGHTLSVKLLPSDNFSYLLDFINLINYIL